MFFPPPARQEYAVLPQNHSCRRAGGVLGQNQRISAETWMILRLLLQQIRFALHPAANRRAYQVGRAGYDRKLASASYACVQHFLGQQPLASLWWQDQEHLIVF